MIKLIKIEKQIRGKKILNEISLELPDSGMILINGKNGSGKTTLLNIIGGLDIPSSGEIWIDNKKLSLKEKELCKYREENISYIFQDNNLFDNLSVEENINIVGKSEEYETIVKELKIDNLLEQKARDLSGGERQRVAIARAIVKSSKIILADEPTASIDKESKHIILEKLKELSKDRLVILVSHDKIEIPNFADMIINLDNGMMTLTKMVENFNSNVENVQNKNICNFNVLKFAKDNFKMDKKKTVRNSILFLITNLFLLLLFSISVLDFKKMLVDTLIMEKDNVIMFNITNKMFNDFNEEEINFLKNNVGFEKVELGYNIYDHYNSIKFEINTNKENEKLLNQLGDICFFDAKYISPDIGRRPFETNEIVISSFIADLIISSSEKSINYEDLIDGYLVKLGNQFVKIVGIYKVNLPPISEMSKENIYVQEVFREIIKNIANNVYVKEDFLNLYSDIEKVVDKDNYYFPFKEIQPNQHSFGSYDSHSFKIFRTPIELIDGTIINDIQDEEVIVNSDMLDYYHLSVNDVIGMEIEFNIADHNLNNVGKMKGIVKGVSKDNNIYLKESNIPDFLTYNIKIRKAMIHNDNRKYLSDLIHTFPLSDGKNKYEIMTNYSKKYDSLRYTIEDLKKISVIITAIFLLMTVFFLYNYVKSNIELYKKDIALLKSLGISSKKIMLAFLLKSINISMIAFVCAFVSYIVIRLIINLTLSNILAFKINIIPLGWYLVLVPILSIFVNCIISLLTFNKIKKTYPQLLLK